MTGVRYSILIVDSAIDFGGSIVSTANLIRGLDRAKFCPIFVSAANEALVRSKLGEASDTTVVVAKKALHYGHFFRLNKVLERIKLKPLRKFLIYAAYAVRLLVNVPYGLKLARLIREHEIDLVQLNNGFGNDELELVCSLLRIPRVIFFRGYVPLSAIERRFFLPRALAFVAVSKYVKSEAAADGVPSDKILVATPPAIPEQVDAALVARVRKRYGLAEGTLVFGIFGRVVTWKGQKEFVRAASIVMQSFPNSRAFIVGDTSDGDASYLEETKAIARELGIADRVTFTGYVEKVHELYSIMDLVVHASIEPEPSGRVIFETMSFGVPIVASCYGGPKEFIEDGVDGFVCDPKDDQALADRICRLLSDAALRRSFGMKGQSKVETLHNKKAYAAKIEQIYLDCLRSH